MKRTPIPLLRTLLSYDPDTGIITWSIDTRGGPGSKPIPAGTEAGTIGENGYRYINIQRVPQLAHRIAWAITHGRWPKHQIDHINMDRSDNRLLNLREASNEQNTYNRGAQSNNRTGIKGITKTKSGFFARIRSNGEDIYLGHFKTADDAKSAYDNAAMILHGKFMRT